MRGRTLWQTAVLLLLALSLAPSLALTAGDSPLTTMDASQQSFLSSGAVVVPAGATVPYNCTGQMLLVKEASGPFRLSFNDGEFFKCEVGLAFRLTGGEFFTRLQFRNETSSDIVIEFFAGAGEVMDNRLNTDANRLIVGGLKVGETFIKSQSSLAPGYTPFWGTWSGFTRKQFVLFNPTSIPVQLFDYYATPFDVIQATLVSVQPLLYIPGRFSVETSGRIWVHNPRDIYVSVYVQEVFYTS